MSVSTPSARPPARPLALITGASAGIGLELARRFAATGHDLVLVARRRDRLDAIATELAATHSVDAIAHDRDLAAPDAATSLVAWLDDGGRRPDVLVNNAGFGAHGHVAELDADRQRDMVQLNVLTLTELTRLLLPAMLERRRGGVLNVASTAAFQPAPYMCTYFATKAFVLHFSEGLAAELRGTGVRCCCLCPGPTATEFGVAAGMEDSNLFTGPLMSVDRCADLAMRGWDRRRPVIVTGAANRIGAWLAPRLPRRLVLAVGRRLLAP
jgi:short-subunit dehydrogenase